MVPERDLASVWELESELGLAQAKAPVLVLEPARDPASGSEPV